jgi:Zn-dependent protease
MALNLPYLMNVGIWVLVLLFSIIIHEVAHGYVALRNGDPTAKLAGRITLNPIPHIDLMGSIILPVLLLVANSPFLFGWAKPVPVNPMNYRNLRWGEATVSLAGPGSNLLLAVMFALFYKLGLVLGMGGLGLAKLAETGMKVNVILAVFNLIPIPPLDGSHILATMLPYNLARLYAQLEPFGFIILLVLFYTGIISFILLPIYKVLLGLLVLLINL